MKLLRHLAALAALSAAADSAAFILPTQSSVYEFQNERTGHYLLLASDADIANMGLGAWGPGWSRTGHYFTYWSFGAQAFEDRDPVCRFHTPVNGARFFTASPQECAYLRQPGTGWILEHEQAFVTVRPGVTGCADPRRPVYRLYNNRHALADPNHRYTADPGVRAQMLAAGWVDEGIAFCAVSAGKLPDYSFDLMNDGQPTARASLAACEARTGDCVAMTQLPAMPTHIQSWLPPFYVTKNPNFPWGLVEHVTGLADAPIFTSQQEGSSEVLRRSFLQMYPLGEPFGIHIDGTERLAGVYAGMSPMLQLPSAPTETGDERVFPWRDTRDRELVVSAEVQVQTVRRANSQAHAYGMPLLQFTDKGSGRSFYLTLQSFGTVPAGDFVGPDLATGRAIVSTSFRAAPAFGRRVSGEFVLCDPASPAACIRDKTTFAFAFTRADFREALDRARSVDPALSASVSDYFLSSFRFHNETYLDAQLGMAVHRMRVEIWP